MCNITAEELDTCIITIIIVVNTFIVKKRIKIINLLLMKCKKTNPFPVDLDQNYIYLKCQISHVRAPKSDLC